MVFIVEEETINSAASFGHGLPFYGSKILYFRRVFAKLPLVQRRALKSSSIISQAFLSFLYSLLLLPCSLILLSLTPSSSLFLVSLFLKVSFSPRYTPSLQPDSSGPGREGALQVSCQSWGRQQSCLYFLVSKRLKEENVQEKQVPLEFTHSL